MWTLLYLAIWHDGYWFLSFTNLLGLSVDVSYLVEEKWGTFFWNTCSESYSCVPSGNGCQLVNYMIPDCRLLDFTRRGFFFFLCRGACFLDFRENSNCLKTILGWFLARAFVVCMLFVGLMSSLSCKKEHNCSSIYIYAAYGCIYIYLWHRDSVGGQMIFFFFILFAFCFP